MMKRRHFIASAAVAFGASRLPVHAQESNPMPAELRKALERDPNAPVLGNPNGDITLTEFFDYNCPFCAKMLKTVQRLVTEDKNLRVVYRELPVFGEGSDFAARASLASLKQGKYWQFHATMLGMKDRAVEGTVIRTAREVGLDVDKLRSDMEAQEVQEHINRSFLLADHMGLLGTPTFIAGNEAVFGEQSLKDMKALIERGREALS